MKKPKYLGQKSSRLDNVHLLTTSSFRVSLSHLISHLWVLYFVLKHTILLMAYFLCGIFVEQDKTFFFFVPATCEAFIKDDCKVSQCHDANFHVAKIHYIVVVLGPYHRLPTHPKISLISHVSSCGLESSAVLFIGLSANFIMSTVEDAFIQVK